MPYKKYRIKQATLVEEYNQMLNYLVADFGEHTIEHVLTKHRVERIIINKRDAPFCKSILKLNHISLSLLIHGAQLLINLKK